MESPHQLETLLLYAALMHQREHWGGKLVLACGPHCAQSGTPPAVGIAGGACLAIEADAVAAKTAMRLGELDFVVNTLDEALRTLKNEVRQQRPLSVGLIANVDSALAEVVARGLQPDLLLVGIHQPAFSILHHAEIQTLAARGMTLRAISATSNDPDDPLAPATKACFLPAGNAAELRAVDERLLSILPPADLVRRRWIQHVPRYLREARTGGRWIWLSEEEQTQLAS